MYLKSLKINDFRKFGRKNNIVEFVDSKDGLQSGDIDIASASTLIVGKNNSGKTTITKALEKIIKDKTFKANDFNFNYLQKLLKQYKKKHFINKPLLSFEILVGITENNMDDLVNNFVPFINIGDTQQPNNEKDFKFSIRYELEETQIFEEDIKQIIEKYTDEKLLFRKYIELLDILKFEFNYYDSNDKKIENSKFKIDNLINIETISANKIIDDSSLSKIFSKIIKYKYELDNDDIQDKVEIINEGITKDITDFHTTAVNPILHEIEDSKKFEIYLSSNLTVDTLLNNLIKYEYTENGLYIPEGQFGLGYANLMSIIGQLIDYIEKYPEEDNHSKLNLICIEEPEAFMHPQMQELFIKNINNAIKKLLAGSTKKINTQLIITTHSSHILNSKIHTSNSFNNINYIMTQDNVSNVVTLNDSKIIINSDHQKKIEELKFLKKHIKFKVSELFFADAIIFVEGITEETLLSYYISINEDLNKKYITVFNINGAHGLVYHNLIKMLKIPTLIITDLDIKRSKEEKEDFTQMEDLSNKESTNKTITKYKGNNDISHIPNNFIDDNLYITFQSEQIEGYYATSLEEALILQNFDNDILNDVINEIKPNIYKEILSEPESRKNLADSSYKLQSKLSSSKSDFANTLLYQFSINEDIDNLPKLPKYIDNSLTWLKNKLCV